MVENIRGISEKELQSLPFHPRIPPWCQNALHDVKIKKYKGTLHEMDFETVLHVFNNRVRNYYDGWNLVFKEDSTVFSTTAKRVYSHNFEFDESYDSGNEGINNSFRKTLAFLKKEYTGFNLMDIFKYYLVIYCLDLNGPYMIADGNHRLLNYYIKTIIEKEFAYRPLSKVILAHSKESNPLPRFFDRILTLK